jgi:hypothetical protein
VILLPQPSKLCHYAWLSFLFKMSHISCFVVWWVILECILVIMNDML